MILLIDCDEVETIGRAIQQSLGSQIMTATSLLRKQQIKNLVNFFK